MIPPQQTLSRSQSLHLPHTSSHDLHRSANHRFSIAPQPPSHYQSNSTAPSFQSAQSQSTSPSNDPVPSIFTEIDDTQPLLAPEPNPKEEISRWSSDSDSDDSLRLLIPKLFVKSKTLPQLQLQIPKSVSGFIAEIAGSTKKRFGLVKEGKESAREKKLEDRESSQGEESEEPLTQVNQEQGQESEESLTQVNQEQGQESEESLTQVTTGEQDQAEDPEQIQDIQQSLEDLNLSTISMSVKRSSLSSFLSNITSSSTSTIKPRSASSPDTTIQSSSSSITSTGSSSTIKPNEACSSAHSPSGSTAGFISTWSAKLAPKNSAGKKIATRVQKMVLRRAS
ncbi:hypothetical protein BKA64DRAFT_749982 [Cadophora sp. MPI-SDFR-AT-0126]|nr:hypothetical protein BKA64DRAFT_749982 [Leotiomycetes sp. MPI-SDFR-AT-0126]